MLCKYIIKAACVYVFVRESTSVELSVGYNLMILCAIIYDCWETSQRVNLSTMSAERLIELKTIVNKDFLKMYLAWNKKHNDKGHSSMDDLAIAEVAIG